MPGFFSFHKLVSTSIIKLTYVIGFVLVTLWSLGAIGIGIAALVQPDNLTLREIAFGQPIGAICVGVVVLILGNLLWRLLCEGWILLFSIHELLASIADSANAGALPHVGYQRTLT